MKKRILSLTVVLSMVLAMIPVFNLTASAAFDDAAGGTGTSDDPYQIETAEQLKRLSESVQDGNTYSGYYFKLTSDIDLGGNEDNQWTPIGSNAKWFSGNFDGGNHTISGLYINDDSLQYQGLFGYIRGDQISTIKNLTVKGSVTGGNYVGGIAGYVCVNRGHIDNCHNEATVSGIQYVGGITGESYAEITNCSNTGVIKGEHYVGGIIGNRSFYYFNSNTIDDRLTKNCYNTGEIIGEGYSDFIGGILGRGNNVMYCYNTANVNGQTLTYVGGIIGRSVTVSGNYVSTCYNVGLIGTESNKGGGIIGYLDETIYTLVETRACYYLEGTAADASMGTAAGGVHVGGLFEGTTAQFKTLASDVSEFRSEYTDSVWAGRPLLNTNKVAMSKTPKSTFLRGFTHVKFFRHCPEFCVNSKTVI